MSAIEKNLAAIHRRIADSAQACGRNTADIRLLAVSKTRPIDEIKVAIGCGQLDFGENYLQEAEAKIAALGDERVRWHYIGPIQSNKTRAIANNFAWVHSVDRLKIAQRLSEQRSAGSQPLNICLQVNISGEPSKAGFEPGAVAQAAVQIAQLPNLRLRGLMAIPKPSAIVAEQRQQFARLRQLLQSLQPEIPTLDTLSMGMSADMEAAVMEGATWLRIGTAIFGPRLSRKAE